MCTSRPIYISFIFLQEVAWVRTERLVTEKPKGLVIKAFATLMDASVSTCLTLLLSMLDVLLYSIIILKRYLTPLFCNP